MKLQKFNVSKRFDVWVERPISAADLSAALEEAKEMELTDFVKVVPGAGLNDWNPLPGTSISEDW